MLKAILSRGAGLPRDSRDTLFLLVVIAWLVVLQVDHLPLWCTALVAGVLGWRGWLAVHSRPLPGKAWLAGLLAATLAATWWTHGTLLGRNAGVTLIVVLLGLKTLELRARRDAFVIFFLGFFTLLTNFFHSQSLAMAAAMAVAVLGLLTILVNAHLSAGRPPLARSAAIAGRMLLLGTPLMVALFVLFPRLPPLWGIPGDALAGRSGLAGDMEVGQVARLALDDGIAMRVRFDGQPPARTDLYFRGPVLSNFDGRQWRPLYRNLRVLPSPEVAVRQAALQVEGDPVRYDITMEPNNRPWLPVLDATLEPPVVPGRGVVRTPEIEWQLAQPVTDVIRFSAQSHPRYGLGRTIHPATLPPEYRDLPDGFDPRTRQLAAELMRTSAAPRGDKAALVAAALERLRTGGYAYTLEPGVYGLHTADEFWFDRKAGFCEHIASAFVILMRAMDIPARVVTGFQGGELNPVDGYWVVRNSDAHAWTEVWLEGRGWVRIDPTSYVAPGRTGTLSRLQPAPGVFANAVAAVNPTLAASLRNAWEALNNAWNQRILNYTQSRQLDLLRHLGFESPSWPDLARVLAGLVAVAAVLGAAWTLWERRQHDPWLRLLALARERLARAGMSLPASSGPRQLAAAVTARYGAAGEPVAQWLLRLEAQRYARGGAVTVRALAREWKQLTWPT